MRFTPQLNVDSCKDWLSHLKSLSFIDFSNEFGHLIPPFTIFIPNAIHKEIVGLYPLHEETGGLMFASLTKKNDKILLTIDSIIEIENDVENVFPGESKTNSYFPECKQYIKILSKNFSLTDYRKILFPVHFHTHPTNDKS